MIDQFFAFLNFIVLIIFLVYCFRRYVADILRGYITMEQVSFTNIQRRHEQLIKQEQSLIKAGQHQHDTYHELSRNVAAWNAALHAQEIALKNRALHVHEQNMVRMQEQKLYIQQHIIRKEVLPRALSGATIILEKMFQEQPLRDEYMQATIQKIVGEKL